MRIGLMRQNIEVWDIVERINGFGVVEKTPSLLLQCPAAITFEKGGEVGNNTKGYNKVLKCVMRFNRAVRPPVHNMFIRWDGQDFDITNDENWWSLNKYITLTLVNRTKGMR